MIWSCAWMQLCLRKNGNPTCAAILKQVLRRTEMPHAVPIEPASELDAQRYK